MLPNWVGDVVMATPTLAALRRQFSSATITLLAKPMMNDLIKGSGWADEVISWESKTPRPEGGGMFQLAGRIRKQHFDWAILLTNSFRSALVAWLASVPRRIGYARDGRRLLLTDRLPVEREKGEIRITRMVDYYGKVAEHLGCPPPGQEMSLTTSPAENAPIRERLDRLGMAGSKPLIVISPGASFGASKLWLPERFAALADRVIEAHGAAVVISCAPAEMEIGRRILELMKQAGHLLDDPPTTLGELKSLLCQSDLLICNDAGARHIAKAFKKPVVTIFGPTHPGWTDTDYACERKVMVPVDCGPCQLKKCPEDHRCMTGVTVEMVALAVAELLPSAEPRRLGAQ